MNLLSFLFGPPVPAISAHKLEEKLRGAHRPLLIDVRQPEEYRQGHIAGAKLIPLNELRTRIKELPKNKEIVCVCASGSRSRSAAKLLIKEGYQAIDMNGGMFMWQRAGLPVSKK